ncbi:hypothetical protein TNIN_33191 [Trichonephila inaurata madagascariensis]|uniref:Uncharacterized protein n=1 Tax=Trichonephila inaurata madagascariensis TaxID=2747483 RepID=A0A8X7CUX6_9ARAC|nr:hypothetical protein TNIN_33191 [Trichonephila inaurata madagascariensis]
MTLTLSEPFFSEGLGGHRGPREEMGGNPPPGERTPGLGGYPSVRAPKRSKVSEPVNFKIPFQDEPAPPVSKKSPTPNLILCGKRVSPT